MDKPTPPPGAPAAPPPQQADPSQEIDTGVANRILLEICLNRKPATPDTPAMAEMRKRLTKQVADIKAAGGIVEPAND